MGDGMNSKRPVVPEGLSSHDRQLAVYETPQATSGGSPRPSRIVGLVWCSVGSALVPLVPVLSCALAAFGMAVLISGGGRREQIMALLVALVAGLTGTYLLFGVYGLPMTALSVLCAFALARELAMGRLRSGGLIAEAAAVSLAMVGVDMVSTSLQGTSITELITDVVNQAVEMSTESLDLDGVTAVLETRDSLLVYWPTVYFVVGTGIALCSLFGAWLGVRTSGGRVEPGVIARFDVPLWVAELFALGVVADVLGPRLPQWQREVAMVGANVVMCTRIVLAQQGISVLLWRLRERGAAWPRRAILAFLALWLEMSFALMSIVGIVDVAVNLRHLERNRQDLSLWPARER